MHEVQEMQLIIVEKPQEKRPATYKIKIGR
jgi:hypothetical protein